MSDPYIALFSMDGAYRYLWCENPSLLDRLLPPAVFCMHNSSKAGVARTDPTVARVVGYGRRWNMRPIVANRFNRISTDPDGLWHGDPIGDKHMADAIIKATAEAVRDQRGVFVCAWGAFGVGKHRAACDARAAEVLAILDRVGVVPHVLGLSKDGHPRHPLYLRADLQPVPWPQARATISAPPAHTDYDIACMRAAFDARGRMANE